MNAPKKSPVSNDMHTLIHAMIGMKEHCLKSECKEVRNCWKAAQKAIDKILLKQDMEDKPIW